MRTPKKIILSLTRMREISGIFFFLTLITLSSGAYPEERLEIENPLHWLVDSAIHKSYGAQLAAENREIGLLRATTVYSTLFPKLKLNLSHQENTAPSVFATDVAGSENLISSVVTMYGATLEQSLPTSTQVFVEFDTFRTNSSSQNILVSPYYSSTLRIGGTQQLLRDFDWFGTKVGRTWNEMRASDLERSATNLDFQKDLNQIILDIELAYWDYLSNLEKSEEQELALSTVENQLEFAKKRVKAGLIVPADQLQFEEKLLEQKNLIRQTKIQVLKAQDALELLTGIEILPERFSAQRVSAMDGHSRYIEIKESELLDMVTRENFTFISAQKRFDSAKLTYQKERSSLLPKLELTGAYFLSGGNTVTSNGFSADLDQLLDSETSGYDVALNLEIPLGKDPRIHDFKLARAEYKKSNTELLRLKKELEDNARFHREELISYIDQLKDQRERVLLAERKLEFERQKYAQGLTTSYTVLQFIEDVVRSKLSLIDAARELLKAQSILDSKSENLLRKYGLKRTSS